MPPCRDYGPGDDIKNEDREKVTRLSNRLDEHAKMMCSVGKAAEKAGTLKSLPLDFQNWYKDHKKADAIAEGKSKNLKTRKK